MGPKLVEFALSERNDGTQVSHVISGAAVPTAGDLMGLVVAMVAISVLSICLFQRTTAIGRWDNLPFVVWLTFAIFLDSMAFVIATTILQQNFGVNTSMKTCLGIVWLCLTFYVSTKFIYMFLVEKAHIIRHTPKKRLQSKLYLFNSFGMLGCYAIIAVFNFIFHIAKIDSNGVCIVGMKAMVMIPLISFDAVVNIYLTILFLIPLRNLYSFKSMPETQANARLQSVALRTFIGSCCTLTSSIANLTTLMVLQGEPAWVCLLCCNTDVLFSALVIQWVTSKDNAGSSDQASNVPNTFHEDNSRARRNPLPSSRMGKSANTVPNSLHGTDSEISLVQVPTASKYEGCNESDTAMDSNIMASGAVIVTTTIHRQSLPSSGFEGAEGGTPSSPETELNYGYTSRSIRYESNGQQSAVNPPRTYITGGKKKSDII